MTAQTILPANTLSSGFDVANSARFESAQLLRTNSGSTATNIDKYTISVWLKRSKLGVDSNIIADTDGSNNYYQIYFKSDDTIRWQEYLGGSQSGALITNRKFRDVGAWYNLIFRYDSSLGTAGDRMRMYVNGVEETSFATDANPDQNANGHFGEASSQKCIADNNADGREYFGYMCEFMGVDGQSLAPDQFGEFDSDSGIWKPIDISGITQGVHGFYLKFEDSSDLGVATLGSNWTGAGLAAIDQSTDTCTNNFCTMNPLANFVTAAAFSEGNLVTSFANGRGSCTSTFGLTTGKWYVEMNITTMPADERFGLGISPFETKAEDLPHDANNQGLDLSGYNAVIYANLDDGSQVIDNFFGNNTTRFDSFTGIIGMALDLTSSTKTIAFSKAGAWVTGGGTSDTDFSNALKVNISTAFARHDAWHVANGTGNGSGTNGIFSMNFGSPAFAISSSNADGNGFGNFEYAVPSGYLALCTKNLATNG